MQFNEQGVPVSTTFDDIYFSVDSGIDESQYVFLDHNQLTERWQALSDDANFTIAETGFGTGLNFLLTWMQFLTHAPKQARLHFVSFEKYPLSRQQLEEAYRLLSPLASYCTEFLTYYPATDPGCHRLILSEGRVTLDLWIGEINDILPEWAPQAKQRIDAWFLDGFAPAKNPQMWQSTLYRAMRQTAHQHTTFATFTAAGAVKRALQEHGFQVIKAPGFGRKRDMLCGHLSSANAGDTRLATDARHVTVIGGGISAATTAYALARRGVSVRVIAPGVATGASGNPQGAVYPLLHAEHTPLSAFYWQAFSTAKSLYQQRSPAAWFDSGVMQPAFNEQRAQRYQRLSQGLYTHDTVRYLSQDEAEETAGIPLGSTALHYPNAGWLRPTDVVEQLLQHGNIEYTNAAVDSLSEGSASGWVITLTTGQTLTSERVVLATGHQLNQLLPDALPSLPIQPVRGQITQVNTTPELSQLKTVLCYKGYVTPEDSGAHCLGATFNRNNESLAADPEDDERNLIQLAENAQTLWSQGLKKTTNRVSVRATTPDHQPVVGAIGSNLYVMTGLGSRGFTSAPLVAEVLACQLTGELQPLTDTALRRISVSRFKG